MRLASLLVLLLASPAAEAAVKARFLDGVYAMSTEACDKLKALAKGATRSINTVPWSVDRNGFDQWEGGCSFSRIRETAKGQSWSVTSFCEGNTPDENSTESYIFKRASPTTFAVTLTTPGASAEQRQPKTYLRCDVPATR